MTAQFYQSILADIKHAHILCIGDVMLDRFIYGSVDRISPEAPVPVFHVRRELQTLGGAGNVVRNLSALGAHVFFTSVLGRDDSGALIESLLLKEEQVRFSFLQDDHRSTTTKTRFIANGQQMLRTDHEQTHLLSHDQEKNILKIIEAEIEKAHVVILSDYGKGVLTPLLIQKIIQLAQMFDKPVIVDPKGRSYDIYSGCTILTPNHKELAQATGYSTNTDIEVIKAAEILFKTVSVEHLLVTRGAQGMALFSRTKEPLFIPSQALEVFDVSGAGDTVISVLAAAIACDADYEVAAQLSNVAAGIVVAKVGTAVVKAQEILDSIDRNEAGNTKSPHLLSWDQAAEKVIAWHRQGLKVGFTNGCFDLLHPGHLKLLKESKSQCDRLIVAINSDHSVSRLKGPKRPIQSENSRSLILSALECVDAVVMFEEDTPLKVIMKLKPDVLIKGADYTIDKVVGAQEVLSWGGSVHLVDLEQGCSTSNTVAKLSA